jgi:hypothetical protein
MFNENLKVFFEKTDYLLREVSLKKPKIYKKLNIGDYNVDINSCWFSSDN